MTYLQCCIVEQFEYCYDMIDKLQFCFVQHDDAAVFDAVQPERLMLLSYTLQHQERAAPAHFDVLYQVMNWHVTRTLTVRQMTRRLLAVCEMCNDPS